MPRVENNGGMSDLLTLSEGAVLTHLVTRAELTDGVLPAADDLRLWARLADGDGGAAGRGRPGPDLDRHAARPS